MNQTSYIIAGILLLIGLGVGAYFLFRDTAEKCDEDMVEEVDAPKVLVRLLLKTGFWKKKGYMLARLYRVGADGEMMEYSRDDAILALDEPGESSWYFALKKKENGDGLYCAILHAKPVELPADVDPESALGKLLEKLHGKKMKSGMDEDGGNKKKYKTAFWAQVVMSALVLLLVLYLVFRKK